MFRTFNKEIKKNVKSIVLIYINFIRRKRNNIYFCLNSINKTFKI